MDLPDSLMQLQTAADAEHARLLDLPYGAEYEQQWETWRTAAETVQAAITAHAQAESASRYAVEAALKKTVRHPEPEPADA
ncbi:hypothetical protein ACMA1D_01810 [Streptomyces sp. 796.1]|uniref:hypothetical protein n=1 Tax=Streptomyces sp. 796.1 TaxID=3163029 RepID=UPI0039C93176